MNNKNGVSVTGRRSSSELILDCLLLVAAGILSIVIAYLLISDWAAVNTIETDTMRYADAARNLARGKGLTSSVLVPYTFSYRGAGNEFPYLYDSPLYCAVLALFFIFLGPNTLGILSCTSFFFIATTLLVYVMARDAFNRRAAVAAALLFLTNSFILQEVVYGSKTVLLVFLVTLVIYIYYGTGMKTLRANAAAGAVLGLCFLTMYAYWILIFPLMLFSYYATRKKPSPNEEGPGAEGEGLKSFQQPLSMPGLNMLAIIVAFLAVSVPWWLRNISVTGAPLYSLGLYAETYGNDCLIMINPTLSVVKPPLRIATRFAVFRNQLMLFNPYGNFVAILFIASLFQVYGDKKFLRMRNFTCAAVMLIWILIATGVTTHQTRPFLMYLKYEFLFFPFYPLICLAVSGYVFYLVELYGFKRKGFMGIVVVVLVAINIIPSSKNYKGSWVPPYRPGYLSSLLAQAPADSLVFSDNAVAIAWIEDRETALVPLYLNDYREIDAEIGRSTAFYLSPDFAAEFVGTARSEDWRIIMSNAKQGYLSKMLGFANGIAFDDTNFLFY